MNAKLKASIVVGGLIGLCAIFLGLFLHSLTVEPFSTILLTFMIGVTTRLAYVLEVERLPQQTKEERPLYNVYDTNGNLVRSGTYANPSEHQAMTISEIQNIITEIEADGNTEQTNKNAYR